MTAAPLPVDGPTLVFAVGLLYTVMPLSVWTILRSSHDRISTSLWCGGALLSGVAYTLFGLRAFAPDTLTYEVANGLGVSGYALRWASLRRERALPRHGVVVSAAVAAAVAVYVVLHHIDPLLRGLYNTVLYAFGSAWIALEALRLGREARSRSMRMVSWVYAVLAAAMLVRTLGLATGLGAFSAFGFAFDTAAVFVAGMLTALWGNIGYLGFALEHAERRELVRRAERDAATEQRQQAERQAAELKGLSDERQELLRVVAHEVRQPLHNAQAVLQGVENALRNEVLEGDAAGARVARARTVIRQITDSVDNILAASTVLLGERPAPMCDTDIDMLLELVLGDLPPAGRPRVRIVRDSEVRTAAMDVGLMRLALRNLLNNALAYSLPGSPVTLRLADSDDPLAVVFEVADLGPGIPPELLPRLFTRGVRGRHDLPGQGLGLYIVRQAMRRQGGRVDVRSTAQGTVFSLCIPQGLEPA